MLYEIAHIVKKEFTFVWNAIEWLNAEMFALRYMKSLNRIDSLLNVVGADGSHEIRRVDIPAVPDMAAFFKRQPEKSYTFFRPHAFDDKSLYRMIGYKSFLAFYVVDKKQPAEIVGYFFLRSFINGSAYRGYMVDYNHFGQGIGTMMGRCMNRIGDAIGLDMYMTVSPKNEASMRVSQSTCHLDVLRTLDNGEYLIRCTSKLADENEAFLIGGGNFLLFFNLAVVPQKGLTYAA